MGIVERKLSRMTRVFFGRGIGSGEHEVSPSTWADFLATQVKPCFEQGGISGWTTYEAQGYWEGDSEETFVLEVITDSEKHKQLVRDVCQAYADRFKQKSIYRAHIIMEGSYDDFLAVTEKSKASEDPPVGTLPRYLPGQAYIVARPAEDEAMAMLRAMRVSSKVTPGGVVSPYYKRSPKPNVRSKATQAGKPRAAAAKGLRRAKRSRKLKATTKVLKGKPRRAGR